jgi:hypothetical protein
VAKAVGYHPQHAIFVFGINAPPFYTRRIAQHSTYQVLIGILANVGFKKQYVAKFFHFIFFGRPAVCVDDRNRKTLDNRAVLFF